MLREIRRTKQIEGEPRRRWFLSDSLDLVVWLDEDEEIVGFQLCYDKPHSERALTWGREGGLVSHMAVDDGESVGLGHKETPVLVPDGAVDLERILGLFDEEACELPLKIATVVKGGLESGIRDGGD